MLNLDLVTKKLGPRKTTLKDSKLDIFIGLNINEEKIFEIYQECGEDIEATLSKVINTKLRKNF